MRRLTAALWGMAILAIIAVLTRPSKVGAPATTQPAAVLSHSGPSFPMRIVEGVSSGLVGSAIFAALALVLASTPIVPIAEAAVLIPAVNEVRQRESVVPVWADPELMAIAQLRATDNAARATLSHTSADGSGAGEELDARLIPWLTYAELIGWDSHDTLLGSGDGIARAWSESSAHRGLMLSGRYVRVGVGFARDAEGRGYWAMVMVQDPPPEACATRQMA